MPAISACPDLARYRQMASGEMAPEEKEALLRHLEGCNACAGRVESLPEPDTLVELLRQARTCAEDACGEQIARLVQRLSKLGPTATVSAGEEKTVPPAPPSTPMLPFACPACGKKLTIKESAAGKKLPCPSCQQLVQAPDRPVSPGASEAPTLPPVPGERADSRPTEATNPSMTGGPLSRPEAGGRELYDFLAPPQGPGELGRLGHYRVLGVLGTGGMGVVFQADEPALKRKVALKAMLPGLAVSESARQRFLREAQAAAAIEHDHIVPIYYVGVDRGLPFLAMPFLQGEPLDERLEREGRLPVPEVLRIGREMAEGLAAAHDLGLIHRDIKPANVWLETRPSPLSPRGRGVGGEGGRVKILDFGLARAAGGESHLTQTGAIVGTPAYMAPEQARGEAVDGRGDLFSLGCVLYRMCTGQAPFQGRDTISTIMAVATEQPPPPRSLNPGVSPVLEALILGLLAKEPGGRPADAHKVAETLAALERDLTAPVPASAGTAPSPPTQRGPVRRLLLVGAAAVLLAGMLAAAVVFSLRTRHGNLEVTVSEPGVKIVIDGQEKVILESKKTGRIELIPGEHRLTVKRGEEELYTETFTLKSGGEVVINARWTPKAGAGAKPAGDEGWLKAVAAMQPEDQVAAVAARLKARNPGFDGKVTHNIEGVEVTDLEFNTDRVRDLSPVRVLTGLRTLRCSGSWERKSQLADLSPLQGMKLTSLSCTDTQVSDLAPLAGMPLAYLNCSNTKVSDLAPLADIPLKHLECAGTRVPDLSRLKDLKLKHLNCSLTRVADLSPLKGMPLTTLDCQYTRVSDLLPLAGMPLTHLDIGATRVVNLSQVKGMKLTYLGCGGIPVSDLSPLASMKLTWLALWGAPVSDLSPLKGMPLTYLNCERTKVTDLSPLKGMPLTTLNCSEAPVANLSPLKGMPLKILWCNFKPERDAAILRSIKTLETINTKPAAEFWKEVEAKKR